MGRGLGRAGRRAEPWPGPARSFTGCSLSGLEVPARGRMHWLPLWPQLCPAVQALSWAMEEGSQLSDTPPASLQQPRGRLGPLAARARPRRPARFLCSATLRGRSCASRFHVKENEAEFSAPRRGINANYVYTPDIRHIFTTVSRTAQPAVPSTGPGAGPRWPLTRSRGPPRSTARVRREPRDMAAWPSPTTP